jgi:hypothetical protein
VELEVHEVVSQVRESVSVAVGVVAKYPKFNPVTVKIDVVASYASEPAALVADTYEMIGELNVQSSRLVPIELPTVNVVYWLALAYLCDSALSLFDTPSV